MCCTRLVHDHGSGEHDFLGLPFHLESSDGYGFHIQRIGQIYNEIRNPSPFLYAIMRLYLENGLLETLQYISLQVESRFPETYNEEEVKMTS